MNNSIIDEVRAARAALAEEHGYDRKKILEWARKKQAELKSEGRGKEPVAKKKQPGKSGHQAPASSH